MKAILPAAEELAKKGVDAVMVMGTSLTFYKGAAVHRKLIEDMARATGLPVGTMSQAIIDGLREVGRKGDRGRDRLQRRRQRTAAQFPHR